MTDWPPQPPPLRFLFASTLVSSREETNILHLILINLVSGLVTDNFVEIRT